MTALASDLEVLSQREFRFGSALRRAFGIYSRNAVSFSIVGMFAYLPVAAITLYSRTFSPNERALWDAGGLLFYLLLQPIVTAVILHAAFQDMRGRPARLGESVQRGLQRVFPLIGVTVLTMLGVILGTLLLIIPGVILWIRWYLAAAVCVVEQKGPLGSLDRSTELTKGNRWKLFAAVLITLIVGAAVEGLIALLFDFPITSVVVVAVDGVWQGIGAGFGSVLTVVFYHDLRVLKEGADIESIASVFD